MLISFALVYMSIVNGIYKRFDEGKNIISCIKLFLILQSTIISCEGEDYECPINTLCAEKLRIVNKVLLFILH